MSLNMKEAWLFSLSHGMTAWPPGNVPPCSMRPTSRSLASTTRPSRTMVGLASVALRGVALLSPPGVDPLPTSSTRLFTGAAVAAACSAGRKAAFSLWCPVNIKHLIFEIGAEILGDSVWCASPYFRKVIEQVARSHCVAPTPAGLGDTLGQFYLSVDELRALPYAVDLYSNQPPLVALLFKAEFQYPEAALEAEDRIE